jgi:hypothetical protein
MKKSNKMKNIFILLFLFLVFSCSKEKSNTTGCEIPKYITDGANDVCLAFYKIKYDDYLPVDTEYIDYCYFINSPFVNYFDNYFDFLSSADFFGNAEGGEFYEKRPDIEGYDYWDIWIDVPASCP